MKALLVLLTEVKDVVASATQPLYGVPQPDYGMPPVLTADGLIARITFIVAMISIPLALIVGIIIYLKKRKK